MDFHDVCRYDEDPDMKFMRYSKHKNGTHLFNTLASVHCVTEGARACLGVLVRTRETFPADAVAALLDMCGNNGIQTRTLLLDREFYSAEIMNLLEWRGINWLMPAVKTDTIKRAVSEFGVGRRGGAVSVHSVGSGLRAPVHPDRYGRPKTGDDARETATGSREGKSESFHHMFATNVPPDTVASDPDRFVEMYRRRWGIETAFRCYEQVRPMTTGRNESVKLLFFP